MRKVMYGSMTRLIEAALVWGAVAWAVTPAAHGQDAESLDDGFMTRVVTAGDGKRCVYTPCRIFFRMPQETGALMLEVNGLQEGPYGPGELVDLGSFSDPTVRIHVIGGEYRPAFVNMPGLRSGG